MHASATSLLVTGLMSSIALAQTSAMPMSDDVPMQTYLALLAQVAPPARDGAEAYIAAFEARCRRPLTTIELRRAFAAGNGDPTLLGMVRAAHQRDKGTIQRLGAGIVCP